MQDMEAYRLLIDHVAPGMVIVQNDRPVFASQPLADMLGYPRHALLKLTAEQAADFLEPEYRSSVWHIYRLVRDQQDMPRKITARFRNEVIPPMWVELTFQPAEYKGQPAVCVTFQDMHERQQTSRELSTTYEQINRFFYIVLDLLCIADNAGNFVRVNQAWEKLLGYPVEDLEGRPYMDFVHPDDVAVTRQALQNLRNHDQIIRFTNRYRTRGGEYRLLEWQSIHYDGLHYAAARDITDQQNTETVLRQREESFRALVENSPDSIQRMDREGRHLYVNPAYAQRLGLSQEELAGKTNAEIGLPPDLVELADSIRQKAFTEKRITETEFVFNGQYYSSRVIPEFDENGDIPSVLVITGDITPQKQIEQQLRQREESFRALVENSPDLVSRIEQDSTHLYVNPALARKIGKPVEQIIGKTNREIYEIEYPVDEFQNLRQRIFETGEKAEMEMAYPSPEGSEYYDFRLIPEFDASGHVTSILSIARDITERKRIEMALQQSEERARSLLEAIPDIMFRLDREGTYLDYYAANHELYEQTRPLIGQKVLDTLPPDFARRTMDAIEKALTTDEMQTLKYRLDVPGQGLRYYEARMVVSGPDEVTTIVRDVTATRRTEERYRSAIEASLDAFYLLESVRDDSGEITDFRIVEINEKAMQQLGMPREALLNGRICELFPVNRTSGFFEQYRQVAESGQPFEQDYMIPAEHTAPGWYHHQVVKVGDGVAIVNRDITERKQMQRKEIELYLSEERGRLLREFVQAASHEFRTPLTIINTGLYILKMSPEKTTQQKQLQNIGQSVEALTTLVDSMLMMIQLEDQESLEQEPLDFNRLIEITATRHHAQFRESAITPVTHYTSEPLPISGDSSYIQDALKNIIENAIQFTPPDGTITITTEKIDHHVYCTIADTGPGIHPETLPRIFEQFYRADDARTRRGFGLGLPIALKIIELHDGTIHAESEPGQGATFTVILPLD